MSIDRTCNPLDVNTRVTLGSIVYPFLILISVCFSAETMRGKRGGMVYIRVWDTE